MDELLVFVLIILLGLISTVIILGVNALYKIRDAVEVMAADFKLVRCKECKHSRPYKHTKEYVACEVDCDPIDRDSDFFCKDGESVESDG